MRQLNKILRNKYLLVGIICLSAGIFYFGKPFLNHLIFSLGMHYNQVCKAALVQGAYKAAIDSCKQAIQIAPRHTSFYWHLGIVLAKAGEYDEAIENYTKALETESWDLDRDFHRLFDDVVYFHRGLAYFEQQKYQNALADFEKAIQKNPIDPLYAEWQKRTTEHLKK